MARYKGTVVVEPTSGPFGSVFHIAYTTTHPRPWAHFTITSLDGSQKLCEGYPTLWSGVDYFYAGPTPSWSGGPGTGVCDLVYWDGRSRFTKMASTTFEVTG